MSQTNAKYVIFVFCVFFLYISSCFVVFVGKGRDTNVICLFLPAHVAICFSPVAHICCDADGELVSRTCRLQGALQEGAHAGQHRLG